MKYIKQLTWLFSLAVGLTACSDDNAEEISGGLVIDRDVLLVSAEGGSEEVAVSATQHWVANTADTWLMVTPANGIGSATATVKVDTTLLSGRRDAEVTFVGDNGQRRTLTVSQFGFGKQIAVNKPEVEIENSASYDDREFDITVSANVECKIGSIDYSFEGDISENEMLANESERQGWLLNSKNEDKLAGTSFGIVLDRKARPRSVKFKFRWTMNVVPATRVAKVHLVPVNADDQLVDADGNPTGDVVLTVRQKAAPRIEDNRAGDSLSVIMINQKLNSMSSFDTSDNMRNWSNVTLWEATDAFVKQHPEALGRVRSVKFSMINLKSGESLPKEVANLRFLESFTLASNENSQIREVSLGDDICSLAHLKHLSVQAYGMTSLPSSFVKLGASLESLNLSSNNFSKLSDITNVINEQNFPRLTSLVLNAERRTDVGINLSAMDRDTQGNYIYNTYPIGMYGNVSAGPQRKALLSLLTWDNLRTLRLSYCFLEGELPTDDEIDSALRSAGKPTRYSASDFSSTSADWQDKLVGDTCKWLLSGYDRPVTCRRKDGTVVYDHVFGSQIPRVLPKCRTLSLNLNFFTGDVPKWVLFHPHLVSWNPETLLFTQQERGVNTLGASVGFANMKWDDFIYDYYYGTSDPGNNSQVDGVAYPLYYRIFVAAGDVDDNGSDAKGH